MTNALEEIKSEHSAIERELFELEEIINSEEINYPNLIHTLKKLYHVWDEHENKEEAVFSELEREEIKIPVEEMKFEHRFLRSHKKKINDAINSGSDFKVHQALKIDLTFIIKKLREHLEKEDQVLYTIALTLIDIDEIERAWQKSVVTLSG